MNNHHSHRYAATPAESPPSAAVINAAAVRFVRVLWIDASGQHRCRMVPEKRFNDVVIKNGIGIPRAVMGLVSFKDAIADETDLTEVGEIRLLPDLSTKAIIPWATKQEMVISDMHLKPGTPWDLCPREALRRVSKVLKHEFNLVMNAGFENEFYLLRRDVVDGKEILVPFDTTPYCSTSAIDQAFPLLSEIVASLQSLNIVVEQVHSEIGYGQYEVVLGYKASEQAADDLVYTREVIRSVARKHGLLATFAPKYSDDDMGSGSHVHISLSENGHNVFMARNGGEGRHGMSETGEAFMAGVLDHLPSILAFTAPVPNSYDRIQPNTLSGAYLCWGMDNREAPLRTACPPGTLDGLVSNFELKVFDGCANPYLGLASIMAAGIDGLRRHATLPEPIDANPDTIGDVQRLPQSLAESVEALDRDHVLQELIGQKLSAVVKGVRKAEIKYDSEHKDARKDLIYRY